MSATHAAIATTRFGMGARPGDIAEATSDPAGWLIAQLTDSGPRQLSDVRTSQDGLRALMANRPPGRRGQREPTAQQRQAQEEQRRISRRALGQHISQRTSLAVATPASFTERWIRFWSNHFSVSAKNPGTTASVAGLEAEIIRPLAFNRFEDLLVAVETHPAMLTYLDNARSVGPNSRAGQRRGLGINENLAREILELHTLGVNGGYSQDDVEALANTLTGWTVGRARIHTAGQQGDGIFDPRLHEPGRQRVLGETFSDNGADQARNVLRHLARQPATRRFVCTKLARHFLADTPAEADITHLEQAWSRHNGDLAELAMALVASPGAFAPEQRKFKTPEEFLISSMRALEIPPLPVRTLQGIYQAIGQRPFSAPSPQGWPDTEGAWSGPDAIMKRIEFANEMGGRIRGDLDPRSLAPDILGARLNPATGLAIARASSVSQGLTLLLMSPEFQRR
jgi:uncharacterized protein (DUF1800 family)